MKDSQCVSSWWSSHLTQLEADGRADAERGIYNPPCLDDDDPQNQDENAAYKQGFTQRRKELGDSFKWA